MTRILRAVADSVQEVAIADIHVGDRLRKDLGDLESLATSIAELGLLQPIGITQNIQLIFGLRRLVAIRDVLRRHTVPARVIDLTALFDGQLAENSHKELTVTERVALAEALRSFRHGGDRRSDQVRICEVDPISVEEAARRAGLGSKDAYYRAKTVVERGTRELVSAMDSGEVSISAASTIAEATVEEQRLCLARNSDEEKLVQRGVSARLRRLRATRARAAALRNEVPIPCIEDPIKLFHCPFQQLEAAAGIPPSSVHMICTDIPYGDDFMPQMEDLAVFAERVLVQGGVFVCHLGQLRLDDKLATLARHLTYTWMCSSRWQGEGNYVPCYHIISRWIPIVVMSKGQWNTGSWWNDTPGVNVCEKDWHKWQRPLEEVETLIRHFSRPGNLVVDPCGGGFTTALACYRLGRRCISCDIDKPAVVRGHERLAQAASELPASLESGAKDFVAGRPTPTACGERRPSECQATIDQTECL